MTNQKETRNYSVEASPRVLDELEKFLAYVQFCGFAGTSQELTVFCDGDGSGRVEFRKTDGSNKDAIKKQADEFELSDTNETDTFHEDPYFSLE